MARRTLPSRLEVKRPAGSASEAPRAKVVFTELLYTSPVQINPSCDHTGIPHFHSSTTSGSACLISARSRDRVLPRQSLSSLIRASINCEGNCEGNCEAGRAGAFFPCESLFFFL